MRKTPKYIGYLSFIFSLLLTAIGHSIVFAQELIWEPGQGVLHNQLDINNYPDDPLFKALARKREREKKSHSVHNIKPKMSGALDDVWKGVLKIYRPKHRRWDEYTTKINFSTEIVHSEFCLGGPGRVTQKTSSIFIVDWPRCGLEKVSYSITDRELKGDGIAKAYSDGRIIKNRKWYLTK